MSSAFARNLAPAVLATPSVLQTQWGVEDGTLIYMDLPLRGPYASIGAEASPPLAPLGYGAPFDRASSDEQESTMMADASAQHWWPRTLCDNTGERNGDLLTATASSAPVTSTASSAPAAAVPAADPVAVATAVRCSERIQQRAASQPSQPGLDAAATPPVARRRRQRRSATSRSASATPRQRPSALRRKVGAGLKGRPPKGQGFSWDDPAVKERMRQLKDEYLAGNMTQSTAAEILRREFQNDWASHPTVCRRFKLMP